MRVVETTPSEVALTPPHTPNDQQLEALPRAEGFRPGTGGQGLETRLLGRTRTQRGTFSSLGASAS